jgi:hypothetical protein
MSNETHIVSFGKNLVLEMRFEGEEYENATVKFTLKARDGRPALDDSPAIPVKSLFAAGYLIDVSLRRNALMVEQEVLRMQENMKGRNKDGKENKKK